MHLKSFGSALLLNLFAVLLFATETRVNTLGGVNELIIDNSNVKNFPSLLPTYRNEVIAEIKTPSLICLIDLGKWGILGIDINSDSLPAIIRRIIENESIMPFVEEKDFPEFNVSYGRKFSANSVGLKIGGSNFYYEKKETECLQSTETWNSSIGIESVVNEKNSLQFAIGIEKFKINSNGVAADVLKKFQTDGDLCFYGKLRILSKISESNSLIFGMNYESCNIEWSKTCEDSMLLNEEEKMTSKNIEGYIGINSIPLSNTNITFGMLIGKTEGDTITQNTTFSNTGTILPKIVIGIENQLTKWLTIRTGITKFWLNSESRELPKDEIEAKKEISEESLYSLSLGWSFKFNNFELDILSNDIPFITPSISLGVTYKFSIE